MNEVVERITDIFKRIYKRSDMKIIAVVVGHLNLIKAQ